MKETDLIVLANEWEQKMVSDSLPNSPLAFVRWLDNKGLLNDEKFKRNPYQVGAIVRYMGELCDVVQAPNHTFLGLHGDEHFPVTLLTRNGDHIHTITSELERVEAESPIPKE